MTHHHRRLLSSLCLAAMLTTAAATAQDVVMAAFGSPTGTPFDIRAVATNRIHSVVVRSGAWVDGLSVNYRGQVVQAASTLGATSGTASTFQIPYGQYLTRVDVWYQSLWVNQIALQTNTGLRVVFGQPQAGEARHDFIAPVGREIVGLVGTASALMNSIGVVTRPVLASSGYPLSHGSCGIAGPEIRVQAGSGLLRIGQAMTLEFYNVPGVVTWKAFAYGFNTTSWNGNPLPTLLGAYGAPTCWLAVAPDFMTFGPTIVFSLPNNPGLCGINLAVQGAYGLPSYNALGTALTYGYTFQVGAI